MANSSPVGSEPTRYLELRISRRYSDSGTGERPLFLGASVKFALREAVKASRASAAVDAQAMGVVQVDSPAMAERSRVAVGDWIVQGAKVGAQEGEKRFFVEATA
ncbi:hypothetical protein B9Z19DRAFT_1125747 [Tuber borchii]|uniref:Uncharacterized protein n=1 Tax=Tuber borchii TaxID=42251 RepID=A0A2T6ZU46_TUBBO|nr:hypothetical protein B9Z19DRAFT_1125747 [Tuber borchii]